MFSGIITTTQPVHSVTERDGLLIVSIQRPRGWRLQTGDSVAVDGVCSTVAQLTAASFTVAYMPETRNKTTVDAWVAGDFVNLELSLRLNDFVHGHLVAGHVDGRGTIRSVHNDGSSKWLTIAPPRSLMKYIPHKGSIAVDGVSLTVASVTSTTFDVALVEHTLQHTTLDALQKGDTVNIEIDLLVRYVKKLIQ